MLCLTSVLSCSVRLRHALAGRRRKLSACSRHPCSLSAGSCGSDLDRPGLSRSAGAFGRRSGGSAEGGAAPSPAWRSAAVCEIFDRRNSPSKQTSATGATSADRSATCNQRQLVSEIACPSNFWPVICLFVVLFVLLATGRAARRAAHFASG